MPFVGRGYRGGNFVFKNSASRDGHLWVRCDLPTIKRVGYERQGCSRAIDVALHRRHPAHPDRSDKFSIHLEGNPPSHAAMRGSAGMPAKSDGSPWIKLKKSCVETPSRAVYPMFCAISNVERRNNMDFVAAVGVSENVVILDDGGNFIRMDGAPIPTIGCRDYIKRIQHQSFAVPNRLWPDPPRTFSLWSRTQKKYSRPVAGGLLNSKTANLRTRRYSKPVFPATSLSKLGDSVFTQYAP